MLQRIFLSAVTLFFACVVAFAVGECSAFAGLVEGYSMNCVSFTFWTVRVDFFGNVHFNYQLSIKETYTFLYFMTFKTKNRSLHRNIVVACSIGNGI